MRSAPAGSAETSHLLSSQLSDPGPLKRTKHREVQCDTTLCSDAEEKTLPTLPHFPSAVQNPEVTKEETVFIQPSGAVCVQAYPLCTHKLNISKLP